MMFSPGYGLTAIAAATMISTSALAGGAGWTTDYEQAQATAQTEGKDLLLEFTGSDWCPPCQELARTVFSHDSFAELVNDHFVLVELDFPNGPQSDDLKTQNRALADRYGITGFPTVLLVDTDGMPYASTGFQPEATPESYAEHLEELRQARVGRDAGFAAAEEAEGLEKAQHLHDALQAMGDAVAMDYYEDVIARVMELDADNEAGIKAHYDMLYLTQEQLAAFQAVMRSGNVRENPQGTLDAIDAFLADEAITPQVRQQALATKSQVILGVLEDRAAARAVLEEAIDVDPDSELGRQLQSALERVFGEGAE